MTTDVTGVTTKPDRLSARGRHAVPQNVSTTDRTAPCDFDADPLQQLLYDAFVVQESEIDTESLSAIVEVQGLIATGKLDIDAVMDMIAVHAQNVADATGIAIGLLNGEQLVYRAGSGSAAAYVGKHVIATLCISRRKAASREILRVENAETDTRIESAICRQFGAQSLLILPIHRDRDVVGVLEVLFTDAHTFEQREVRTYRLMADLVEEAMSCAACLEHKTGQTADLLTMRQDVGQISPKMQISPKVTTPVSDGSVLHLANNRAIRQAGGDSFAATVGVPALKQSALAVSKRRRGAPRYKAQWETALVVAVVLVVTCGIAYRARRTLSPAGAAALQRSNPIEQRLPIVPTRVQGNITSKPQNALDPGEDGRRATTMKRWVRVGDNEIDYVTEDVTVRYFTPIPGRPRVLDRNNQVRHISEDVTVRYFTPQPPLAPPPVARTPQPVGR